MPVLPMFSPLLSLFILFFFVFSCSADSINIAQSCTAATCSFSSSFTPSTQFTTTSSFFSLTDGITSSLSPSFIDAASGPASFTLQLPYNYSINTISLYYYSPFPRIYYGTIVELWNHQTGNWESLYNSDRTNSAGRGFGSDSDININGINQQFNFTVLANGNGRSSIVSDRVRVFSNGNSNNVRSQWTELLVYAPACSPLSNSAPFSARSCGSPVPEGASCSGACSSGFVNIGSSQMVCLNGAYQGWQVCEPSGTASPPVGFQWYWRADNQLRTFHGGVTWQNDESNPRAALRQLISVSEGSMFPQSDYQLYWSHGTSRSLRVRMAPRNDIYYTIAWCGFGSQQSRWDMNAFNQLTFGGISTGIRVETNIYLDSDTFTVPNTDFDYKYGHLFSFYQSDSVQPGVFSSGGVLSASSFYATGTLAAQTIAQSPKWSSTSGITPSTMISGIAGIKAVFTQQGIDIPPSATQIAWQWINPAGSGAVWGLSTSSGSTWRVLLSKDSLNYYQTIGMSLILRFRGGISSSAVYRISRVTIGRRIGNSGYDVYPHTLTRVTFGGQPWDSITNLPLGTGTVANWIDSDPIPFCHDRYFATNNVEDYFVTFKSHSVVPVVTQAAASPYPVFFVPTGTAISCPTLGGSADPSLCVASAAVWSTQFGGNVNSVTGSNTQIYGVSAVFSIPSRSNDYVSYCTAPANDYFKLYGLFPWNSVSFVTDTPALIWPSGVTAFRVPLSASSLTVSSSSVILRFRGRASGPYTISSVAIGYRAGSVPDISPASFTRVTFFGGATWTNSITIPAGTWVDSDPIPFCVEANRDLLLSFLALTGSTVYVPPSSTPYSGEQPWQVTVSAANAAQSARWSSLYSFSTVSIQSVAVGVESVWYSPMPVIIPACPAGFNYPEPVWTAEWQTGTAVSQFRASTIPPSLFRIIISGSSIRVASTGPVLRFRTPADNHDLSHVSIAVLDPTGSGPSIFTETLFPISFGSGSVQVSPIQVQTTAASSTNAGWFDSNAPVAAACIAPGVDYVLTFRSNGNVAGLGTSTGGTTRMYYSIPLSSISVSSQNTLATAASWSSASFVAESGAFATVGFSHIFGSPYDYSSSTPPGASCGYFLFTSPRFGTSTSLALGSSLSVSWLALGGYVSASVSRVSFFMINSTHQISLASNLLNSGSATLTIPTAFISTASNYRLMIQGSTSSQIGLGGDFTVQQILCPALQNPINGGSVTYSNPARTFPVSAQWSCPAGFDFPSGSTTTSNCNSAGQWTFTGPPTCRTWKCPAFPGVSGLQYVTVNCAAGVNGTHSFGGSCSVSCPVGFSLSGPSTRTCNASRVYDNSSPPACVDIDECALNTQPGSYGQYCDPSSTCFNVPGSFYCSPIIISNTTQIISNLAQIPQYQSGSLPLWSPGSTNRNFTLPGSPSQSFTLGFQLRVQPSFTNVSVYVFPASYISLSVLTANTVFEPGTSTFSPSKFPSSLGYSCTSLQTTPVFNSKIGVFCTLPPALGTAMKFITLACRPDKSSPLAAYSGSSDCAISISADQFWSVSPSFTPLTIRSSTRAAQTPGSFVATDNGQITLIYKGYNFISDANLFHLSLYLGPVNNPLAFRCPIVASLTNDTQISCRPPASGSGSNLFLTLQYPGGSITSPDKFSYSQFPTVDKIYGSGAGCRPDPLNNSVTECSTTGGAVITLTGINYIDSDIEVLVNGKVCEDPKLLDANGGNATAPIYNRVSHISCTLPAGTGLNQPIIVSSNGQFSNAAPLLSYAIPSIDSISASDCTSRSVNPITDSSAQCCGSISGVSLGLCTRGGVTITIQGNNFGSAGAIVRIGSVDCANVRHSSLSPHSILTCEVQATRASNQQISVIQFNGSPSVTPASYNAAPCPAATFNNVSSDAANAQCSPCAAGSANSQLGSTACSACNPGTYADTTQLSSCIQCPTGRATSASGAVSCPLCPKGRFASALGSLTCSPCDLGSVTTSDGLPFCLKCPSGTRADRSDGVFSATGTFEGDKCTPCSRGEFQSGAGQTICSQCAPGKFAASTGSADCPACPAGSFSAIAGASICLNCTAGSSSPSSSTSCSDCSTGRYAPTVRSPSCLDCPAGRFASSSGASACLPCQPGSYSLARAASCTPCSEGFYSVAEASACVECINGTYSNQGTGGQCINCPVGSFSISTASIRCEACAAGTYSSTTGASVCRDCPAGFENAGSLRVSVMYGSIEGTRLSTPCSACAPGFYSARSGSQQCSQCGEGTYTNSSGMSACSPCAAGRYQPTRGATGCIDADPGYYVAETSAAQQTPCTRVGTYSATAAATICSPCSSGKYSAVTPATSCKACPTGQFQPYEGSSSCRSCAAGQYLVLDGSELACEACPSGAVCNGQMVAAQAGYYVAFTSSGRAATFTCTPGLCESCEAQLLVALSGNTTNSSVISISPVTGMASATCCASGRVPQSLLCGTCLSGYSEWSGSCVPCDSVQGGYLVLFVIVSWIYVVLFHNVSQVDTADTKIFLYYVQMILVFFTSTVNWLGWLSIFQFNFSEGTAGLCVAPLTPMEKLISGIVAPLICFAELFLFIVVHGLVHQCKQVYFKVKQGNYERKPWDYDPFIRSTCGLLLFSYNSIVDATLKYFNCSSVNGVDVVASQPSIQCSSSEYTNYLPLFTLLLVGVVCGFPIVLGCLMYIRRHSLYKGGSMIRRYGLLYATYKPTRWWYEVFVLIRRVLLLFITVLMTGKREELYSYVTFMNLLVLLVHLCLWPFLDEVDNLMEAASLVILAMLTALLTGMSSPINNIESAGVTMLVFIPGCLFLLFMIQKRVLQFKKELIHKQQQQMKLEERKRRKAGAISPRAQVEGFPQGEGQQLAVRMNDHQQEGSPSVDVES